MSTTDRPAQGGPLVALVIDPASGQLRYPAHGITALPILRKKLTPKHREWAQQTCERIPCTMNEFLGTLCVIANERRAELAGLMTSGEVVDDALDWIMLSLIAERMKGRRDAMRQMREGGRGGLEA